MDLRKIIDAEREYAKLQSLSATTRDSYFAMDDADWRHVDDAARLRDAMKVPAFADNESRLIASLGRSASGYVSERVRRFSGSMASREWQEAMGFIAPEDFQPSIGFAAEIRRANEARHLAEQMQLHTLPPDLAVHAAGAAVLATGLLKLDYERYLFDEFAVETFAGAAATASAFSTASRVDRDLTNATQAFKSLEMPTFSSLADHRAFFDAAGLILPRWPRRKVLTHTERRRRLRRRIHSIAEPPQVRKARTLFFKYERALREIIDEAMTEAYGPDWARERLPVCGCKTLLGRAESRGGEPLDHADFAHYSYIMCHPEHFAQVFDVGFEDLDQLADLIERAKALRAKSHHPHDFTADDLREVRLVFSTLEAGLAAFVDEFEYEDEP